MPLTIALDYDGTVTADPDLWIDFLKRASARNHRVAIVTMRSPDEPVDNPLVALAWRVIYTSRQAKQAFVHSRGIRVDIWIDDQPNYIFEDAAVLGPALGEH